MKEWCILFNLFYLYLIFLGYCLGWIEFEFIYFVFLNVKKKIGIWIIIENLVKINW